MSERRKPRGSLINEDFGVQVSIEQTVTSSPSIKANPLADLGYGSLNSTPKQKAATVTRQQEYEQDDTDDNVSNESAESSWKTKVLAISSNDFVRGLCCRKDIADREGNEEAKMDNIMPDVQPRVEPAEPERLEWDKKLDFLLSIIGFAVDLANVWRFPYLCYKNGGGVFLIPYTLMLIFGALPLFFMELALGQFAKAGPIALWTKICPAMKGVGYCCVLISWRKVLQINKSTGLSDMGSLRPEIVGCVVVVFVMLYFSLFKGVKSSGKVVWVTATAPYAILTILLIRGLFLPGAGMGIMYYLSPRFEKLLEVQVWIDAAVQVFFSIGVGFGVHLTYASFNKFNNNCYRDALITAFVNSCTSFYSGFVIFTFLGYMAHSLSKDIENVAEEGYGLVFQVYPEAISTLPFARFWSLLFFFMLVTLGLDSAMGGLEAVITSLMDEFKFKSRERLTFVVICTSFLGTLINCTQGGGFTMYWFDNYSAGVSLLCSALFEAIAITYCYGLDKFASDIESMIGFRPYKYWQICWKYISPLFLVVMSLEFKLANTNRVHFQCIVTSAVLSAESLVFHEYHYPTWATTLGWMLSLSSVSAIPVYAAFYWLRRWMATSGELKPNNATEIKANINSAKDSPIYV
ncbi:Sodium-dependent noradrenaline transporter [Halotydeus destructor]|nr:Sodium-dependent noradrenaline transporter [Halotydeus destructor]